MMTVSIPLEQIVPGVWEVWHPAGYGPLIVEVAVNLTCVLPWGGERSRDQVRYWLSRGWQFTARYIRCAAPPVECWAQPASLGALFRADQLQPGMKPETMLQQGFVRGVFVPLETVGVEK